MPTNKKKWIYVAIALPLVVAGALAVMQFFFTAELRHRLSCASNLKAIAQAMNFYGAQYHGAPDTVLDWLLESDHIPRSRFVCRSTAGQFPHYVWREHRRVDENSMGKPFVILFEPASNHGGDGGNVLFADGHVEFVGAVALDRLIAKWAESRISSD